MKLAVFSSKPYDERFFKANNIEYNHDLRFFEARLTEETVKAVIDYPGVCVFVNDELNRPVLEALKNQGTELLALRCAGFNNVDVVAAAELGITIVRVPSYSPHSIAEHTLALILSLCRQTHRAYHRVRDGNFSLQGLLGMELHQRTVGIIGTGKIGSIVASILQAFGCRLLAFDIEQNDECVAMGVEYVELSTLYSQSDIISLHCPLNQQTHHLIDSAAFEKMRHGIMLINTGRGAIIDTQAAIAAIKSGKLGYLGLDVYEQESDLFFEDLSDRIISDDTFQRLLTFPNVIITGHQGFFTKTALDNIAKTTLQNVQDYEQGKDLLNQVTKDFIISA